MNTDGTNPRVLRDSGGKNIQICLGESQRLLEEVRCGGAFEAESGLERQARGRPGPALGAWAPWTPGLLGSRSLTEHFPTACLHCAALTLGRAAATGRVLGAQAVRGPVAAGRLVGLTPSDGLCHHRCHQPITGSAPTGPATSMTTAITLTLCWPAPPPTAP